MSLTNTTSLPVILFLLLCFWFLSGQVIADNDEEVQREALEKVRRDIGRMQTEIRKTQKLHDSVQKEIRKLEIELAKIGKELSLVKRKIRREKNRLSKLYRQRKVLKKI